LTSSSSPFQGFGSFARPKRNETKKKDAGTEPQASSAKPNDNFNLFWQNALGFTPPKKAEVRAISGLPPHDPAQNYC
jgi:hypothetical protein